MDYYLDPVSGNDANTGASWAQAWKTITGALQKTTLLTGDRIWIADGTLAEGTSAKVPTQCSGKTITLQAVNPGAVTITGTFVGLDINSGVTTGLLRLVGINLTTSSLAANGYLLRQYFDTNFSLEFENCNLIVPDGSAATVALYSSATLSTTPVRTLSLINCTLHGGTGWNGYAVQPEKLALLTIDGLTITGSVRRLVSAGVHLKAAAINAVVGALREALFVGFSGVTTCDVVKITNCNVMLGTDGAGTTNALFLWAAAATMAPDVIIHDNVASGYGDCIYLGHAGPTASGRVSILRNVLMWDAPGGGSYHGIGPFDNTLGGVVAHNTVRFAPKAGTYALVLKGNYIHAFGNVLEAQFAITATRGNGLCVTHNTARSNLANGHALKLARHTLIGDYWPENGTFQNNILDAGLGNYALHVEYEAGKSPPAGFFNNRFNANLLHGGTTGRANLYGTLCADLAALRTAWAALETTQGALPGNDADSLEGNPKYLNLASGDFRLAGDSPAKGDGTLARPGMGAMPTRATPLALYWW